MTTSFRTAHAWLRGYSDALAEKQPDNTAWPDFDLDYRKGWISGLNRLKP